MRTPAKNLEINFKSAVLVLKQQFLEQASLLTQTLLLILAHKCLNICASQRYLADSIRRYLSCDRESPLIFSYWATRLKRTIGPFVSLVCMPETVYLHLFRESKLFLLKTESYFLHNPKHLNLQLQMVM